MLFFIGPSFSLELTEVAYALIKLNQELETLLASHDYGDDVKELFIGVICVAPQFQPFFKVRRPKYTRERKVYQKDGFDIESFRSFEYEFELDFENLRKMDANSAVKYICSSLLESFIVLDIYKHRKQLHDFDINRLKSDIKEFLLSNDLITK